MTAPVIHHFEAKLYALRKSKDGTIVSWVVHPHDDVAELINLRIGSVVNIAWTLEDDKPVEVEPIEVKGPLTRTKNTGRAARSSAANGNDRAAEAIDETAHRSGSGARPERPPTRSLAEKIAILCGDWRFRKYLTDTGYGAIPTAAVADNVLKMRLGIESKTELNDDAPHFNAEAAANAKLLVMTYESHLLSEKYADVEHR